MSPQSSEPRRIDQITTELPKVDPLDLEARRYIKSITEILCRPETSRKFATGEHLQTLLDILEASTELVASSFNNDPEIAREALDLLKRRLRDTDFVTGLERRDKQTDRIREAIKDIAETGGDFDEQAKHLGFISFDVRGLKMVNDLMKDHKYGDEYLKKVRDITNTHVVEFIRTLVGPTATINLARDGGDEFSILITNAQVDLTKVVSTEDLLMIEGMEEHFTPTMATAFMEESGTKKKTVMQQINDFVNFRLAQEVNDIIPEDKLAEFMEGDMPPEFKLKFFVASGAATLSEIVATPKHAHFKNYLARKSPTDGKEIINTILSALRTRADEQSYEVKGLQNARWINSQNLHDEAMIRVISRNDVTVTLAKIAKTERTRANQLGEELAETHIALRTCLHEKKLLSPPQA